jgi:hypothetical protein
MKPRWLLVWVSALCLAAAAGCWHTPQLGGNEACMTAVDALWTAINVKRSEFVDQSDVEIKRLKDAGEMPQDAFDSLQKVVSAARAGQWPEARKSLKTFISDQRPDPRR